MTIRPSLRAIVAGGVICAAAGLAQSPASAHPHIFIDTGMELIHGPDGRIEAVRITWTYDELFSLLLLEDLGLDDDYDGVLTEEETQKLQGFDMDWPDDWEGDVYAEVGGVAVPLGPPQAGPAALLDNGMLTSVHTRALDRPVDGVAEELVVKVYDPTFYTSYTILPEQVITRSPNCTAAVFAPDLEQAYAFLEAALQELGAQIDDPFEAVEFPAVGDRFAEEVRLTCGPEG
jgi:ABC-type uncharacterized transport system substrate-binding protein